MNVKQLLKTDFKPELAENIKWDVIIIGSGPDLVPKKNPGIQSTDHLPSSAKNDLFSIANKWICIHCQRIIEQQFIRISLVTTAMHENVII